MEILVLSRGQFEQVLEDNMIDDKNVEQFKDTIFISILSHKPVPASKFHLPVFKEEHPNVLTVKFDDVIADGVYSTYINPDGTSFVQEGKGITSDQAEEIVDFLSKNIDKNAALIHCAAGVSRSGAVGAFLDWITGGDYNRFRRKNPKIHENITVLRALKEKWNERKESEFSEERDNKV